MPNARNSVAIAGVTNEDAAKRETGATRQLLLTRVDSLVELPNRELNRSSLQQPILPWSPSAEALSANQVASLKIWTVAVPTYAHVHLAGCVYEPHTMKPARCGSIQELWLFSELSSLLPQTLLLQ